MITFQIVPHPPIMGFKKKSHLLFRAALYDAINFALIYVDAYELCTFQIQCLD